MLQFPGLAVAAREELVGIGRIHWLENRWPFKYGPTTGYVA